MIIENEVKLDYSDVLLRPKRSTLASRKDVNLSRSFIFKHSKKSWTGIPIIASNMDGVGTFKVCETLSKYDALTCIVKHYEKKDWLDQQLSYNMSINTMVSTGTSDDDFIKLRSIIQQNDAIQFICIDVANGYSEHFCAFVSRVRSEFLDKTIIAGNVVTADMTQELILSGADIVKVGIGGSSVCLTRVISGVGYPQLSAVIECADAAHGLGGHIIADGGCNCPGDVMKAFGANADFVMLGSMLAGTDEGGGDILENYSTTPSQKYVEFYGMSSETAQRKHNGGLSDYRSSEGRTVRIPYKGSMDKVIKDILGGVRSGMTYIGARNLKDIPKCTTFIRVNNTHNKSFEQYTIGR